MSNIKKAKSNLKTKERATKDELFYFDEGLLKKILRKDIVYKDIKVKELYDIYLEYSKVLKRYNDLGYDLIQCDAKIEKFKDYNKRKTITNKLKGVS